MIFENIVIFGATSAIAQAVARQATGPNTRFVLVGRETSRLEIIAQDLRVRGASAVRVVAGDFLDALSLEKLTAQSWPTNGSADLVLIAHGSLPDQSRCEISTEYAAEQITINATSVMLIAQNMANRLSTQGRGCLAVITSVAGDRGRQSNYFYGAAKASLNIFLAGLRHRLHGTGVSVLTIKPGFVATPMTAHLPQGALFTTPERVASDILRAVSRRSTVLYTPYFWRYIMAIIRIVPAPIFHRTKL